MNIPAGGRGTSASTATPSTSASSTQTITSDSSNSSGTQTGAQNTSETQTQTPGRPRTTAFVMPGMPGIPGMPGGGFPGMPGIGGMSGIPGFPIPGFPPPIDPYLPCSSRYFFRQQARLNEQQQFRPSTIPGQPRNGGQAESQTDAQPRVRPEAPNIPGVNIPNMNVRILKYTKHECTYFKIYQT